MRHLIPMLICLLAVSTSISALDTPLVMEAPNGRLTGVVNPSTGTIQIYEMSGDTLIRRTTTNFLAELEFRRIAPASLAKPEWRMLQVGSPSSKPLYSEMLTETFKQLDRPKKDLDGMEPFSKRVLNTELEFWADPPEYDGRVFGVLGDTSLILVIPSTYTIMYYWINGWDLKLAGYRNYRTELYIPTALRSAPTPADLLKKLPDDVKEDHKKALEEQLDEMGDSANTSLAIAPSEPWLTLAGGGGSDLLVLLDTANNRLMTYELRGVSKGVEMQLKSVRNIQIEMLIPSTYKSEPELSEIVKKFNQRLRKLREPPISHAYLKKLASVRSIDAQGASSIQANVDSDGRLVLDFPQQRKIIIYDPKGSKNQLELKAVRDYTIEIGIGIYERQRIMRERAKEFLSITERGVGSKKADLDDLFRYMTNALNWHPHLYEDFEKSRSIRRKMEEDPRWQPLIDQAMADAQKLDEEHEAILEALKKEEEERKKR